MDGISRAPTIWTNPISQMSDLSCKMSDFNSFSNRIANCFLSYWVIENWMPYRVFALQTYFAAECQPRSTFPTYWDSH